MNKKEETIPEEIANCPIFKTMLLFQGKWNIWVLFELGRNKSLRFVELKNKIPGISNTVLTSTLKELEEKGLVHREQFNEIPPHVEYSATEKAASLRPIFDAMWKYGEENL